MGEPAKKKHDYYERNTHYTEVLERCPECGGARTIVIHPKEGHVNNSITKKRLRCTCACKTKPEFLYKCSKCQDTGWVLKEADGFLTGFSCECREKLIKERSEPKKVWEFDVHKNDPRFHKSLPDY